MRLVEQRQAAVLMRQKPALALDPAAIAGERGVRADPPMAGDDDRDRVRAVGEADRAHRFGSADLGWQRAVAYGTAHWDPAQRRPDGALKRGAAGRRRQGGDRVEIAREIREQRTRGGRPLL